MASSDRFLHQLPPSIRAAILHYLTDHPQDRPVFVSAALHHLSEQGLTVSRSEFVKNAIAEAAVSHGLSVAFGRPPLGPGTGIHHPIRRALVQLRRVQH